MSLIEEQEIQTIREEGIKFKEFVKSEGWLEFKKIYQNYVNALETIQGINFKETSWRTEGMARQMAVGIMQKLLNDFESKVILYEQLEESVKKGKKD